jgi:hypothetical protein
MLIAILSSLSERRSYFSVAIAADPDYQDELIAPPRPPQLDLMNDQAENGRWGFIVAQSVGDGKKRQWAISPQFDNAWAFTHGAATVQLNGLWGFINQRGQLLVKPQYEQVVGVGKGDITDIDGQDE